MGRLICKRHRQYKGFRRPATECGICRAIYDYNREMGIKEKRKYPQNRKSRLKIGPVDENLDRREQ